MAIDGHGPIIPKNAHGDFAFGFHSRWVSLEKLSASSLLSSKDAWDRYAGILLLCRNGDFRRLDDLFDIISKDDGYLLWYAGCNLIGLAGSWHVARGFVANFEPLSDNEDAGEVVANILGLSCNLRATNLLTQLHAASADEDTRIEIEGELSLLLEPEDGYLWDGARFTAEGNLNREIYFGYVRQRYEDIQSEYSADVPVFEGQPYDVVAIARRLHARLQLNPLPQERIIREALVFEAATGADCSSMFDDDRRLMPMAATAVVEAFLDSEEMEKFRPGQRYFFGHPIPL